MDIVDVAAQAECLLHFPRLGIIGEDSRLVHAEGGVSSASSTMTPVMRPFWAAALTQKRARAVIKKNLYFIKEITLLNNRAQR